MPEERILILSASAGAGHLVAAQALQEAFAALAPQYRVDVVDVLGIMNGLFRRLYAGGYLWVARHVPNVMGWLYDWMEGPNTRWADFGRTMIQNPSRLPLIRYVDEFHPRLIVHTHYLSGELVAQMRQVGRTRCPQATVTTDFETHRMWVQEPQERYYVATDDAAYYLTRWGAPAPCIRVTGIPVRSGFTTPLPRTEARRRCGLDSARPLVLLLCGGFGVGPTGELLSELVSMPADADVAVIAGKNERLRARLAERATRTSRRVHVVGYTEKIHEWMCAADLVVTKPGGLTVAEALACGLPLVIVNPIPGQETRNSDYLLERQAGIKVNHVRLLGRRVAQLLADRARLESLRCAAQALARPNAARLIAADALQLIR